MFELLYLARQVLNRVVYYSSIPAAASQFSLLNPGFSAENLKTFLINYQNFIVFEGYSS